MQLEQLISLALDEDIQTGDITTEYLELTRGTIEAFLVAKAEGVLAGLPVMVKTFHMVDHNTSVVLYKKDGDRVKQGDEIARIEGNAASILRSERVALNFLQRLSGIATMTRTMVDAVSGTGVKVLDTRKTTPLLRSLEKYAVRMGGGFNHRFGLYDMIMLKENHIRSAGGITQAVQNVKKYNTTYKIEVEVTNLAECTEAYNCGIDRIMLDNMSLEDMRKAVDLYSGKVELEASGNVRLETIRSIAETGVDFISSGALTHSFRSLDISLLFKES
jgi:nicotinate-nucleotide pyrophosphorylase (carboxylating)